MNTGGRNHKNTIEYIKERIPEILEGYECISSEYKNNFTPLLFRCPKGHIYETAWGVFNNKKGCQICRKEFIGTDKKGVNRIYKNKDWMHDQYVSQLKSTKEIGEFCGVDHSRVRYWLKKFGIPARDFSFSTKIGQSKNIIDRSIFLKELNEDEKLCTGCGLVLNKGEFRAHSILKDGLQSICKVCMSGYIYANSAFDTYRCYVDYLSNINYRKYFYYINPQKLPRDYVNYQLDHIYSVSDGFYNDIPGDILASPVNLRIITNEENAKKNKRSDISLEELYDWNKQFMREYYG